jgi:adenylate cyclase class 2
VASSGIETEVKLPLSSADDGRNRILKAGFREKVPRVLESNTLYDTADQSLRRQGMLLRIRRVGERWLLTFKGAAAAEAKYKSRPETELEVSDGDRLAQIFEALGYKPIFRYQKYRTEYYLDTEPGIITLDETPIGAFLELEGPADWIDRTSHRLGFSESSYITESYGGLYLAYCKRNGLIPGDMVFPE